VPVVFLITIAAVLVGIYFAATGRGGELAYEHADHAPLDLGPVSAADIALLRPPTAMWGYNMQVTDEALERIARAMRERDVTIAYLQEQLATLARNGVWAEPRAAYAGQVPETPEAPEAPLAPEFPAFPAASEISEAAVTPEFAQDPEALELPWDPEPADLADAPDTVEFPPAPEPAAEVADAPDTGEFPPAHEPAADALPVSEAADAADAAEVAGSAEAPTAPEPAVIPEAPQYPRTPLVLKASPAKAPPAPEPHEATQPSEVLHDPDATQPSEVLHDPDATQPTQTQGPYETPGPQGAFNTHDWWAEQEKAAREEAAWGQAANPSGTPEDDSVAAAEEQGW
jgi:hypothetical protein